MDIIWVLLLILLCLILLVGVLILITYHLYRWLKKTRIGRYADWFPLAIICYFIYVIFNSIFPPDDFFIDEFKDYTNFALPVSAVVVQKSASFPDQHGHYESCAIIRLESADYRQLYQHFAQDTSYNKPYLSFRDTDLPVNSYGKVTGGRKMNYVFEASKVVFDPHTHSLFIGFLDDGRSIVAYFNSGFSLVMEPEVKNDKGKRR